MKTELSVINAEFELRIQLLNDLFESKKLKWTSMRERTGGNQFRVFDCISERNTRLPAVMNKRMSGWTTGDFPKFYFPLSQYKSTIPDDVKLVVQFSTDNKHAIVAAINANTKVGTQFNRWTHQSLPAYQWNADEVKQFHFNDATGHWELKKI